MASSDEVTSVKMGTHFSWLTTITSVIPLVPEKTGLPSEIRRRCCSAAAGVQALVLAPLSAVVAPAARSVKIDNDAVAHLDRKHFWTDGFDDADAAVPHDGDVLGGVGLGSNTWPTLE